MLLGTIDYDSGGIITAGADQLLLGTIDYCCCRYDAVRAIALVLAPDGPTPGAAAGSSSDKTLIKLYLIDAAAPTEDMEATGAGGAGAAAGGPVAGAGAAAGGTGTVAGTGAPMGAASGVGAAAAAGGTGGVGGAGVGVEGHTHPSAAAAAAAVIGVAQSGAAVRSGPAAAAAAPVGRDPHEVRDTRPKFLGNRLSRAAAAAVASWVPPSPPPAAALPSDLRSLSSLAVVQGCDLDVRIFESEVQLLQEFCRCVQVRRFRV